MLHLQVYDLYHVAIPTDVSLLSFITFSKQEAKPRGGSATYDNI